MFFGKIFFPASLNKFLHSINAFQSLYSQIVPNLKTPSLFQIWLTVCLIAPAFLIQEAFLRLLLTILELQLSCHFLNQNLTSYNSLIQIHSLFIHSIYKLRKFFIYLYERLQSKIFQKNHPRFFMHAHKYLIFNFAFYSKFTHTFWDEPMPFFIFLTRRHKNGISIKLFTRFRYSF